MHSFINHSFRNNNFLLTNGRSIFWEEEKILILSDLHLGKAGHFRKSGIGIPQTIFKDDMQRLVSQIQYFKPGQLLIVGDMFHSDANKEHELFLKWRNDFPKIAFALVKGNHDILEKSWYTTAGIQLYDEVLTINHFTFTHDISSCALSKDNYCFSGHIHPGIKIKGQGRQSLQLPCFYFGENYAILPAFGKFTGTHAIESKQGDAVFALVDNAIIRVK